MSKAKEKVEVSSNPVTLVYPADQYQLTQKVKSEVVRAAGRVNGDEGKLRCLVATLDVLRAHAIARYKAQVVIRTDQTEATKTRIAVEKARNEKDRLRKIRLAKEDLERLEAAAPKSE